MHPTRFTKVPREVDPPHQVAFREGNGWEEGNRDRRGSKHIDRGCVHEMKPVGVHKLNRDDPVPINIPVVADWKFHVQTVTIVEREVPRGRTHRINALGNHT